MKIVATLRKLADRIARTSSFRITLLAVLSAMVVGAFIIILSDINKLQNGDIIGAIRTVGSAYWALVVGSVGSLRAISATINSATPLILCGVSVAVAFKAGLFNIGATGQMLAGGMAALWVGFAMDGPGYIQVPLAVLAGALGGAAFGAIPGILKARTGAHEVITTIMLNNMAGFLVLWLLKTNLFQRADRTDPISKFVTPTGRLPRLFGFLSGRPDLVAHAGFVVAILAVIVYWWFLNRSTTGFEFRAFGMNADAAQYAGMRTKRLTVMAMMFAGAFAGLAGSAEVLGTYGYGSQNFAGDIGFDAIAIALLGRSTPVGTLLAALLFGALQAGGRQMQANTDVPIDLIVVLRALIVMFIAAPLLVKAMWRIKVAPTSLGQTFRGWGS
jgi:simple sugar transport system permease protein